MCFSAGSRCGSVGGGTHIDGRTGTFGVGSSSRESGSIVGSTAGGGIEDLTCHAAGEVEGDSPTTPTQGPAALISVRTCRDLNCGDTGNRDTTCPIVHATCASTAARSRGGVQLVCCILDARAAHIDIPNKEFPNWCPVPPVDGPSSASGVGYLFDGLKYSRKGLLTPRHQ